MRQNLWLSAIGKLKQHRLRHFTPEWSNIDKFWVLTLCPAFEKRVSSRSEISSSVVGIYRYLRGDEVVYIGRSGIRNRASSPEREEWDFETIEYSLIEDTEMQKKWEAYWLDRHVEEHGGLPIYNRVGGEKIGNI